MDARPTSPLTGILTRFRVFVHEHRLHAFEVFGLHDLTKWLILSVLIGLVSGFGAVLLQKGIEFATSIFLGNIAGFVLPQPVGEGQVTTVIPAFRWLVPVITAIGGLVAGTLILKLIPGEESRGADRVIESFHRHDGKISWPVPFVELVASAITMGAGGSAGPEGPAAAVGSGISSSIAQWLHVSPHDRRIVVAAAMGAGIGAIFKAPLGAAVLGTEMLYLWGIEVEALVPALISSTIAYVIFCSFFGYTPIFGTQNLAYGDSTSLFFYALLGIGCGLGGIIYAQTFHGTRNLFGRVRIKRWLKPAIGGLLAGLIGIALPQVLGPGLGWMQVLMSPQGLGLGAALLLGLALAKMVATSLTVGSGGGGGVYAPGIVVGGFIGAAMWEAMHMLSHMPASPDTFVIVGMMAFFGAIGHAPLAVMIMIAEITGSYQLLLPAMISVGIATVIVGRTTIYGSQIAAPHESPAHEAEYSYPVLARLTVSKAMTSKVITILPSTTVAEAARLMHEHSIKALPVEDTGGALVGLVANVDILRVPDASQSATRVDEIMARDLATVHPEDRLDYAMQTMAMHHVGHLPVVSANEPTHLDGIITTSDVVAAYTRSTGSTVTE